MEEVNEKTEETVIDRNNYFTSYFASDCYMLTYDMDLAKSFPNPPEGYGLSTAAMEGQDVTDPGTIVGWVNEKTGHTDLIFIPRFLEFCEKCGDQEFVSNRLKALSQAGISITIAFYLKGTFDGIRQVKGMEKLLKEMEAKKEGIIISPETGDDLSSE
jgi:hypothetical protein